MSDPSKNKTAELKKSADRIAERTKQYKSQFSFFALQQGVEMSSDYRFHPTREWRFNFAFPTHKVAVEIKGLTQKLNLNSRGLEHTKKMEKISIAKQMGWVVLQFTSKNIDFTKIEKTLDKRSTGF